MLQIETTPLLNTNQATLFWIKDVIIKSGYTFGHAITDVRVEGSSGNWSSNVRLLLSYGHGHGHEAQWPMSLFLKIAGGTDSRFADSEVRYYVNMAAHVPDAPLPRCYHAAYSPQSQRYHLLLEDLSSSHSPTWEKQWIWKDAKLLAETFAQWHAPWWDHAELPSVVAPLPTDQIITRYLERTRQGLEPLIKSVEDRISLAEQDTIRQVYSHHPRLMAERARQGRNFTCIHGDPNPGNILWPHSLSGRCYLIDRQPFDWSLQTWIGASDLAYAMVHWWPTQTRKEVELPLLRYYHAHLVNHGVQNYSWEQLWYDYRLSAMQSFYVVGEWCSDPNRMEEMEWVWWPQLQKALKAFDDLECNALFH